MANVNTLCICHVQPFPAVAAACRSAVSAATPLLRAEWLKYFGSFFNKEYEVESQYRVIRDNYNGLKRSAQITAPSPRLVVAWIYLDLWGAQYVVSKPGYKRAYVEVRRRKHAVLECIRWPLRARIDSWYLCSAGAAVMAVTETA
jgi:hypothetical protein